MFEIKCSVSWILNNAWSIKYWKVPVVKDNATIKKNSNKFTFYTLNYFYLIQYFKNWEISQIFSKFYYDIFWKNFFLLSRNEFEELPECVFQLKALKSLLVQHNKLCELSDDIGSLSFLEELVKYIYYLLIFIKQKYIHMHCMSLK